MTLQLVIILKALVEVGLVAFLGQGVLWLVSGVNRERNPIYILFRVVTSPITRLARALAPRFVLDQHIAFVAFFLLMAAEVILIAAKVYLVVKTGGIPVGR